MLQLIDRNPRFDYIYDKYSPLIYGIILKIERNEPEAEKILIKSFKLFLLQNYNDDNDRHIFSYLLGITIMITSEHINKSKDEIGKILLNDFL